MSTKDWVNTYAEACAMSTDSLSKGYYCNYLGRKEIYDKYPKAKSIYDAFVKRAVTAPELERRKLACSAEYKSIGERISRHLVSEGLVDVNKEFVVGDSETTCLAEAVKKDDASFVSLLLNHGADPNKKLVRNGKQERLSILRNNKPETDSYYQIVKLLVDHGYTVTGEILVEVPDGKVKEYLISQAAPEEIKRMEEIKRVRIAAEEEKKRKAAEQARRAKLERLKAHYSEMKDPKNIGRKVCKSGPVSGTYIDQLGNARPFDGFADLAGYLVKANKSGDKIFIKIQGLQDTLDNLMKADMFQRSANPLARAMAARILLPDRIAEAYFGAYYKVVPGNTTWDDSKYWKFCI